MHSTVQQTRSEPRVAHEIAVRVFGLDVAGQAVNKPAWTVDVSRRGLRLKGITFRMRPGEIVGVRNGTEKARFKVVWIGDPASSLQGQMGLLCVEAGRFIWGEARASS